MGYKGLGSPIGSNKADNPLKNGDRYKRAKANRDKTLGKAGLRPPKTPL